MTKDSRWYLGIDLGTTALRAVLLETSDRQDFSPREYPIYWRSQAQDGAEEIMGHFPVAAYLSLAAQPSSPKSLGLLVGPAALAKRKDKDGVFVEGLKFYLNLAIPYHARGLQRWEPKLQLSPQLQVSLDWVQLALKAIIATLNPNKAQGKTPYAIGVEGLSENELSDALQGLEGAIASCPAFSSDAYRFNLREAVLEAGLVEEAGRVAFVEEAIATLMGLGAWQDKPYAEHCSFPLPGTTLAIHGGAGTTELVLVEGGENLESLHYEEIALGSIDYGGEAVVEDLFYQLLYPQWLPQHPFLSKLDVEIPAPGESDRLKRDRARGILLDFPGGSRLLDTARQTWMILQHQREFSAQLGEQPWGVTRVAFEEKVLAPFIQSLNRELNTLLSQTGIESGAIAQVICSGGTASALFDSLQPWLQTKLPQAKLGREPTPQQTSLAARGLVRLPFFPDLCDRPRHQYSDYFLLFELLNVLSRQPLTLEEILRLLEQRGINTRACADRLSELLQGELPLGLVPTTANAHWLAIASQQNRDYLGITTAPLFSQDRPEYYRPNGKQCQRLLRYLKALTAGTNQTWNDPLNLNF